MGFTRRSTFLIKWLHWEYWPFWLVYFPIIIYWLILSIKARSFVYFTASNPGIENGGMVGESKFQILEKIPQKFRPDMLLIRVDEGWEQIRTRFSNSTIGYPCIAKPDVGERGRRVKKIESESDLKDYVESNKVDFLIQEYINLPLELGAFYYRMPNETSGRITSIVIKETLRVIGDGEGKIGELIKNNPRALLQKRVLKNNPRIDFNYIPDMNEHIELVPYGNHCLGALFLSGQELITSETNQVIDKLSHQIDGFYYGRFDLRTESVKAFKSGNLKIMELNGAGAEPAHIYHPGYSLWKGWAVLFHHWKVLYKISMMNHHNGVRFLTTKEGWKEYKRAQKIKRLTTEHA